MVSQIVCRRFVRQILYFSLFKAPPPSLSIRNTESNDPKEVRILLHLLLAIIKNQSGFDFLYRLVVVQRGGETEISLRFCENNAMQLRDKSEQWWRLYLENVKDRREAFL